MPVKDYSAHCSPEPCILIAVESVEGGGTIVFPAGGKSRLIVLEGIKGETVIVGSNAYPASEFDSIVPKTQKVIDPVEWRGES